MAGQPEAGLQNVALCRKNRSRPTHKSVVKCKMRFSRTTSLRTSCVLDARSCREMRFCSGGRADPSGSNFATRSNAMWLLTRTYVFVFFPRTFLLHEPGPVDVVTADSVCTGLSPDVLTDFILACPPDWRKPYGPLISRKSTWGSRVRQGLDEQLPQGGQGPFAVCVAIRWCYSV